MFPIGLTNVVGSTVPQGVSGGRGRDVTNVCAGRYPHRFPGKGEHPCRQARCGDGEQGDVAYDG